MKYESAILKRLIDTYGVVGNPHYISEIIKEFIVQGKERFPNLFTYQADWLAHIDEFGLNPSYTVSYTGQSIYAPNTLEKPVKSAILKGNTGYRDIDTGEILETFEEGRNLELVSVEMPVLQTTGKNLFEIDNVIQQEGVIIKDNSIHITENRDYPDNVIYTFENAPTESVLTFDLSSNGIPSPGGALASIWYEDGTNVWITTSKKVYVNTKKITDIKIHNWCKGTHIFSNIQLEEGTQVSSFEPYKSNILTVNEEVELRGIGDVKDELDLLTGELTERIGEMVLDGSENWVSNKETETHISYYLNIASNMKPIFNAIANSLPSYEWGNVEDLSKECFWSFTSSYGMIVSKTECPTIEEFKQKLSRNPVLLQYELNESTIKTVDLTILDQNGQNVKQLMSFNGGTHFNTMSAEGSPLPSASVSVETDLEETLKVCSLEGNTL